MKRMPNETINETLTSNETLQSAPIALFFLALVIISTSLLPLINANLSSKYQLCLQVVSWWMQMTEGFCLVTAFCLDLRPSLLGSWIADKALVLALTILSFIAYSFAQSRRTEHTYQKLQ